MAKFDLSNLSQMLRSALGKELLTRKILDALELAYDLHNGQFREIRDSKLPRLPYILHPVGVAILANKYFDQCSLPDSHEDIIMSALSHDLLEDTGLTASELGRICSARVAEIVQALTKPGVMQGETHVMRNQRFLEQIIHAGPSAMYLKICDSMQNLSRPEQSPPLLIKKALRKAQREYLTFFDRGLKEDSLKTFYESRIFETSKLLKHIEIEDSERKVLTLEEAVNRAAIYSAQKVLELHDIISIFEELTRATFSSELSKEELFDHIVPGDIFIDQKTRVTIHKMIDSGKLERTDLPKTLRDGFWPGIDRIFLFDTGVKRKGELKRVNVFGYSQGFCPEWVNEHSLKMIFHYLTERLRLAENTKYITLSSDAGSLGLDLLPGDIKKVNFTYNDLIELRDLLKYATYVKNLLQTELIKSIEYNNISLVAALETRIKEPRSIVNKMIVRKYRSIWDIDDIVGFRLVCLNTADQNRLLNLIVDVCASQTLSAYLKDVVTQKTNDCLIESKDGYKAHHMNFSFQARTQREFPIRCEIQIRTVFQDAWARVANALLYKKNENSKEIRQSFKNLSELRDKSDSIIDQISK